MREPREGLPQGPGTLAGWAVTGLDTQLCPGQACILLPNGCHQKNVLLPVNVTLQCGSPLAARGYDLTNPPGTEAAAHEPSAEHRASHV